MPKHHTKTRDEEADERLRVVIYLCGPEPDGTDQERDVPSIEQQRAECHKAAKLMRADVVGEFVDESKSIPDRRGLREVRMFAGTDKRIGYLIVYSKERLACDLEEMYDVAWRLGTEHVGVIAADEHYEDPWITW